MTNENFMRAEKRHFFSIWAPFISKMIRNAKKCLEQLLLHFSQEIQWKKPHQNRTSNKKVEIFIIGQNAFFFIFDPNYLKNLKRQKKSVDILPKALFEKNPMKKIPSKSDHKQKSFENFSHPHNSKNGNRWTMTQVVYYNPFSQGTQ